MKNLLRSIAAIAQCIQRYIQVIREFAEIIAINSNEIRALLTEIRNREKVMDVEATLTNKSVRALADAAADLMAGVSARETHEDDSEDFPTEVLCLTKEQLNKALDFDHPLPPFKFPETPEAKEPKKKVSNSPFRSKVHPNMARMSAIAKHYGINGYAATRAVKAAHIMPAKHDASGNFYCVTPAALKDMEIAFRAAGLM